MKRCPPGAVRKILGTNLLRIRSEKNLTQAALASLARLNRSYISGIERWERNVSIDNVERLAKALGLEPWELMRSAQVIRPDPQEM